MMNHVRCVLNCVWQSERKKMAAFTLFLQAFHVFFLGVQLGSSSEIAVGNHWESYWPNKFQKTFEKEYP